MAAFLYTSILLHQLPDNQGWVLYGVKHNRSREQIALLGPAIDDWLAERFASLCSQNLAGKPNAEID